ncbi:MAG: hypothetical protein ACJAZS_000166 [Alteromonas naphthalenivorans]|jgi:hypothetical protein
MIIMGGRFDSLVKTYEAFIQTGYYFLIKMNGRLVALENVVFDDLGMYYFVPLLARKFSIPIPLAINYFFYGALLIAFCMFLLSVLLLSNIWFVFYSGISFFLLYREGFFRLTDVYVAAVFCTFTLVPFCLWIFNNVTQIKRYHYAWMFASGLVIGYCHYIRSFSSVAIFFFIFLYVLLQLSVQKKIKCALLFLLMLGMIVPKIHFNYQFSKTDSLLQQLGNDISAIKEHPFWHNIYIGFGYTENYLDISYDDRCGVRYVEKSNPGVKYYSEQCEKILRNEVIRIVLKERLLAGSSLFAKLGVVLFFIIACANLGLIAGCFYPKGILEYIFLGSILLSAVPGVLVTPRPSYLSGLTSFAFIYGIYSIVFAFQSIKKKYEVKVSNGRFK